MRDPHSVLGIPRGASAVEVRRAFRRLAYDVHPDRNPSPDAAARFQELREAADRLLGRSVDAAAPEPQPSTEEILAAAREQARRVIDSFVSSLASDLEGTMREVTVDPVTGGLRLKIGW